MEYEIERSNQAVGSLHEFYGISQKVYERGQFWSQSINTQILWSSEGELIVHAQNFPDGQDLYEQN